MGSEMCIRDSEHMMEQKKKHYEHLKKKDPELAQKLKNFYNLSDDDK